MCAIVAPNHPLTKLERQPLLKHIAAYPLALIYGSNGTRQVIALAEQMDRIRLTPKLTTDSITVVKRFVIAGMGIGLLPEFAVTQKVDAGNLIALPIDNPVLTGVEAHIITRLGRQLPTAANQLLLQLISTMRAFKDSRQLSRV